MNPRSLTTVLKAEAAALGFDLVGATPAVAPPDFERFLQWLADGRAGQMHYLADRVEAYRHPRHVLEPVRSILVLAMNYRTVEPVEPGPGQARVSRYAWGTDYHDVIRQRLGKLAEMHRKLVPNGAVRGVVDTAPLLERRFAQLAGLGWIGKNTMLLNEKLGSWLFLAALLSSEQLDYDQPTAGDRCGRCRACVDACPTGALVDAHQLDARKCISYLTIELRGPIPSEFRGPCGDRFFGCDVCQEVCPFNRRAPHTREKAFHPRSGMNPIALSGLLAASSEVLTRRFSTTPLTRPKRPGFLRNAAIALGNRPCEEAVPALLEGLVDSEPVVRATCAWALGHYRSQAAKKGILARLPGEPDPSVQAEMQAALAKSRNAT